MKVRINPDSVRFRLTGPELEELVRTGRLEVSVRVPGTPGQLTSFRYRIQRCLASENPGLELEPFGMVFRLDRGRIENLQRNPTEGVCMEEVWTDADGRRGRFLVYVQQDLGCQHSREEGQ